jgi:RNA polymerase sigma factor (sigma-70 family)
MSDTAIRIVRRYVDQLTPAADAVPDGDLLKRFVRDADAAAFECLMHRHGPLVLGVCRRALGHSADADDAFQATFLALLKNSGGIRRGVVLPGWLYRVAVRICRKITGRRRPAVAVRPEDCIEASDPLANAAWREVRLVLDEELNRLPARLREPLVLCLVQGLARDEAAVQLRWSLGTLKRRLEEGRSRLRARLTRRDVVPLVLAASALPASGLTAAVPRELSDKMLAAAQSFHFGGALPSALIRLVEDAGPVRGFALKAVLAAVVGVSGLTAAGVILSAADEGQSPPPSGKENAQKSKQPTLATPAEPLPAGAIARLGWDPLRVGYASATLTPDEKKVVALSAGAVVHIFDARTGKLIERRPLGDRRDFYPAATQFSLSVDGSTAAAAENTFSGGRVSAWDVASGRRLLRLDYVYTHALSPDGRSLAVVEFVHDFGKQMIRVYDLATGKPRNIAPVEGSLYHLRFTPDGKRLLAPDVAGQAFYCYDLAGAKRLWVASPGSLEYSTTPDSRTVFLAKPFRALDAETGGPVEGFRLPKYEGERDPVSVGDRLLLIPVRSGGVVVWDYREGKELHRLRANRGAPGLIQAFAAADGKTALTNGDGLRRWDLATGEMMFGPTSEPSHSSPVGALTFLPGGQELASVDMGAELRRWDVASGQPAGGAARAGGPELWLTRAGLRTAKVDWSLLTVTDTAGKSVGRVTFPDDRTPRSPEMFWQYALLPDGRRALTYFPQLGKAVVAVTDYAAGKTLSQVDVPAPSPSACFQAFAPCGRWLVANGQVFAVTSGKPVWTPSATAGLGMTKRFFTTPFSPDGRLLCGRLKAEKEDVERDAYGIWEVASGTLLTQLTAKNIARVAFGPDNRTLAYVTGWGVHFLDLETGKLLAEYEDAGVNCDRGLQTDSATLVFSPDGRAMATGHHDGSIVVWKVPPIPAASLTPAERNAAWDHLAGADAAMARQAVDRLAREPKAATILLEKEFKAPTAPVDANILELIRALDSPAFAARERAARRLREIGLKAEPALREALQSATPETKHRIERLLEALDPTPRLPLAGEALRGVRAIEVLERAGTPAAQKLLQAWADQPVEPVLAAEARLALERLALKDATPGT